MLSKNEINIHYNVPQVKVIQTRFKSNPMLNILRKSIFELFITYFMPVKTFTKYLAVITHYLKQYFEQLKKFKQYYQIEFIYIGKVKSLFLEFQLFTENNTSSISALKINFKSLNRIKIKKFKEVFST